jgi:hypothetical protein
MTREAEQAIRKELGDEKIRVALIGPGGERLVKYACILNELKHVHGRAGLGAVMGAKNLKAVAVRGDKKMVLHAPDKVREIVKEVAEAWKAKPTALGEMGRPARSCSYRSRDPADAKLHDRGLSRRSNSGETMKKPSWWVDILPWCPIRCSERLKSMSLQG